jgi:hypothetical protein
VGEGVLGITPIKANLDSGTMRWVSVASTLTLANTLAGLGSFKVKDAVLWRGTPDTAVINGKRFRVGIGKQVDAKTIDRLAGMLNGWDGLTITLSGRLGSFVVDIDIDAYADWGIPVEAGITNIELVTLAEPRGFINDVPIDNFHDMISIDNHVAGVVWGFLDEASGIVYNGRRLVDYIGSIIIMNGFRTTLWGEFRGLLG